MSSDSEYTINEEDDYVEPDFSGFDYEFDTFCEVWDEFESVYPGFFRNVKSEIFQFVKYELDPGNIVAENLPVKGRINSDLLTLASDFYVVIHGVYDHQKIRYLHNWMIQEFVKKFNIDELVYRP
jgi:hypothetical protein